jgi:L-amino acid N-acyltransferase YncA
MHDKADFPPQRRIRQQVHTTLSVATGCILSPMPLPGARAILIEGMTEQDWPSVRAIYVEGMRTGNATFEKSPPEWSSWDAGHLRACRLVACSGKSVLGWAALSSVSDRCVYAGLAEVSVYVAESARGQGVGSRLLDALVKASEHEGIWTLQAGIFPENIPSIELHKRQGFRIVGIRERLGLMNGRWRDVLLMERRSTVSGT